MIPLRDMDKLEKELRVPEYPEWLAHEFTQMVMRDIHDTLVQGAEKLERDGKQRAFWSYIQEPSQESFNRHRLAAFRHALALHERADGQGHAIDYDGKHHLAMALARCFIARGQQIELKRGQTMREMKEAVDE